jgi:hypothetical protein
MRYALLMSLILKVHMYDSVYSCAYRMVYNNDILADAKQRFGELFSVHVYSVQKTYLKVYLTR